MLPKVLNYSSLLTILNYLYKPNQVVVFRTRSIFKQGPKSWNSNLLFVCNTVHIQCKLNHECTFYQNFVLV